MSHSFRIALAEDPASPGSKDSAEETGEIMPTPKLSPVCNFTLWTQSDWQKPTDD
jgi:hypothetical protein